MYSSLDLSGWAGQIIDEFALSGVTTTGSVVAWLQNNIGQLNLAIHENFYNETGVILPDMNDPATVIYTKMYECSHYKKQAQQANFLGYTNDWIEIEGTDQGKIRKVSKTEVAKEYRGLSKDCNLELQAMINGYLNQVSGVYFEPSQVLGGVGCCWENGGYETPSRLI